MRYLIYTTHLPQLHTKHLRYGDKAGHPKHINPETTERKLHQNYEIKLTHYSIKKTSNNGVNKFLLFIYFLLFLQ